MFSVLLRIVQLAIGLNTKRANLCSQLPPEECSKIATQFIKSGIEPNGIFLVEYLDVSPVIIYPDEEDKEFLVYHEYTHLTFRAKHNYTVNYLNYDPKTKRLFFNATVPLFEISGDYLIDGRIDKEFISGEDKFTLKLLDCVGTHEYIIREFEQRGKVYYRVIPRKVIHKPQKVKFNYTGLNRKRFHSLVDSVSSKLFWQIGKSFDEAFGLAIQFQVNNNLAIGAAP